MSLVRAKIGPPMEQCSRCGGHGFVAYVESVDTCPECGGGGVVEQRDQRGRFLPWDEADVCDGNHRWVVTASVHGMSVVECCDCGERPETP